MALGFTTAGSGLQRTSGSFLSPATGFTFCYWLQVFQLPTTPLYSILGDNNGGVGPFVSLFGASTSALTLAIGDNAGSTVTTLSTPLNLIPHVWNHVAVTYNSSTHVGTLYLNGSAVASVTLDITGGSFALERLGFRQGISISGYAVAYYRSWSSVVLTSAQIRAEMASQSAVMISHLLVDTPLQDATSTGLADLSGGNQNWTLIGTSIQLTSLNVGVMLTNTSAPMATTVEALPSGWCQNVLSGGNAQTTWYTYTAQPTDTVVSFWAFGNRTDYMPVLAIYDGLENALLSNPVPSGIVSTYNSIAQIAVLAGHVYYIQVAPIAPSASTAVLVFSVIQIAHTAGSGHINNLPLQAGFSLGTAGDYVGAPLIWVNGVTGQPIRGLSVFPAAFINGLSQNVSRVQALPNGITAVVGVLATTGIGLYLYDQNYLLLGMINLSFAANTIGTLSSDRVNTFYVAGFVGNSITQVTTVSAQTMQQGTTLWEPTFTGAPGNGTGQIIGMAPSRQNTILYYVNGTADGVGENIVRAWDLVNNVALPTFATAPGGYQTMTLASSANILVLADSTVLVSYNATIQANGSIVVHYTPSGVVIQTMTYGTALINWLAHGLDDPTSFWIQCTPVGTLNLDYIHVTTSTGVSLSDSGGITSTLIGNLIEALKAGPLARFGPTLLSQFWVTQVSPAASLIVPTQWQIHRLDVKPTAQGHR